MLNFINLKKLTSASLLTIVLAGSLITQPSLAQSNNANQNKDKTCNSNNGHGNNEPIDIKLSDGTRITGTYDPSNPGSSANNKLTVTLANGQPSSYSQLNQYQLLEFINKVKDIELRGNGSGSSEDCDNSTNNSANNTSNNANNTANNVSNTSNSIASNAPQIITLTGIIRDFSDDHPDFERTPGERSSDGTKFKYGLDKGITTDNLGSDGKPVYAGGSYSTTTRANFDQWYRDIEGVNLSKEFSIELTKQPNGVYRYQNTSFFPINGELFGNYKDNKNFHFTYELHTRFTYKGGEVFNFSGDDDVWVYINGKKVIDIGGVHSKADASVKLDDVAKEIGLKKGETYTLDFFFAERHTTQSNFIIETTLELETAEPIDQTDSDKDGIPDAIDPDDDNNEILDLKEKDPYGDPDGDGISNIKDPDDDGDGILDKIEIGNNPDKPVNTDLENQEETGIPGDPLPDYQDTDSDNDSIPDSVEIGDNPDKLVNTDLENQEETGIPGDSLPDYLDPDSDNDTIPDLVEGVADSDQDGASNHVDPDSDNDEIPDSFEVGDDPNNPVNTDLENQEETGIPGDLLPDYLDPDSDNDEIPDSFEVGDDPNNPVNTDLENQEKTGILGDSLPDYLDPDSDNDEILDIDEGLENENGNFNPNKLKDDSPKNKVPDYLEPFTNAD